MSAGKNPYMRYQIINACFTHRQKLYWTKEELIRKLADYDFIVSKRTLELDLEMMRTDERLGFHAPIAFCRKELAYHYTDKNYSINSIQLSDEQLRSFSLIVDLLQQFRGTKLVKEFEGAIDKIVRGVDVLRRKNVQAASIVQLESARHCKGIDHIDTILEAIDTKQSLRIAHQKFSAPKPEEHVFHPYLLKEYRDRWYALGHSEARGQLITLGLDRMEDIQLSEIKYKPSKINATEFFKHTIGITHAPGPVEEIVLWFSPTMRPYVKTQPLHASQKTIKDEEDGLTISLKLIINHELLSMLLSYCPDVCVLQPASLKDKLSALLKQGLAVNGKESLD